MKLAIQERQHFLAMTTNFLFQRLNLDEICERSVSRVAAFEAWCTTRMTLGITRSLYTSQNMNASP